VIQPIQSSSFGLSRELRRVTVKKVLPKPVDSAACDGQRIPFFQNKNPSDPHFFVFKHNIFSSDLLVKRNSHLVVLHKTRNSPNSNSAILAMFISGLGLLTKNIILKLRREDAQCTLSMRNSTGSPLFSDFKSDLSRVVRS